MILGIDVGILTGFCVIMDDGKLVTFDVLQPDELHHLDAFAIVGSLVVGVEYPLIYKASKLGNDLMSVSAKILDLFGDAEIVTPSHWKTKKKIKRLIEQEERLKGEKQHVKDSFGIAQYVRLYRT